MDLQILGSHPSLCLRTRPCNKGINFGSFASFHVFGRTNNFVSLEHRLCPSAHPVLYKRRPLMVLSFKGNSQNDGSDVKHRSSRFVKTPFQLSHTQKESEEITKSFDAQNHLSFASPEREDSKGCSLAIQHLFEENPSPSRVTSSAKSMKLLLTSFMYFLGLDASISLPMVIFIPWFLIIRVAYGAEVSKELTPLWIIGPIILVLYINIIKGLYSLYTFYFIQTAKLVMNLPTYYGVVQRYVVEGHLKSMLWFYLIKPFSDMKNMDYKEVFTSKLKQLKGSAVERYLDFIESIWPYYCRTIRFLKRANLI